MVHSRTATAVFGIVISLGVSVLLWWTFNSFVFFLFVPFVPFLFRHSSQADRNTLRRQCPTCGFQTTNDAYEYCPKDGSRLERPHTHP